MSKLLRLVAVLVAMLASPNARAYPIPPVTLWQLVQQSDRIVVAQVAAIDTYGRWDSYGAILEPLETWKGTEEARFEVSIPARLVCPAPPRYLVDRRVLAFLAGRDGAWATVGLSYGTLYPDDDALGDFRIRVFEAIAIQAKPPVLRADWLEWHARAAASPGTRWHGLYPLVPESDEVHSYYDDFNDEDRPAASMTLSKEQMAIVAAGFVKQPSTDRTLPMMLTALSGFSSPDVDSAIVSAIDGLLAQSQPPWWTALSLHLALEHFGEPIATAARAKGRIHGVALRDKLDALHLRWDDWKTRLHLEAGPAPVQKPSEYGTGQDTPD